MNFKTKLAATLVATLSSGVAGAVGTPMYIDVSAVNGGNIMAGAGAGTPYGNPGGGPLPGFFGADANTTTGNFTEFGFNQFLATSLYEKDAAGAFTGNIRDVNSVAFLSGANPALTLPSYGQTTLGDLSPLTPPQFPFSNTEGFGFTWGLTVEYDLHGTIPTDGSNFLGLPSFTNGTYNIFFDDYSNNQFVIPGDPNSGYVNNAAARDIQVLGLSLYASEITPANVLLSFNIVQAQAGFLNVNGVDAGTLVGKGRFVLDTNINPAIPNPLTLTNVDFDGDGVVDAGVRQTTLDGTLSPIPEPTSLALLGIGLLGLAARKNKAA